MSSSVTKLLQNSFIYSVFGVLQKAFGFFLLPLYTAYLSVDEYGVIGVINSILGFLVIMYGLALRSSSARFYYLYKDARPEYIKVLWGNILVVLLSSTAFFSLIIVCFQSYLIRPLLAEIPFNPYMSIGLISAVCQPTYFMYQSILRAKQKAKKSAILDFLYFLINTLLVVVFVTIFKLGAKGVLLGPAITGGVFFVYSLSRLYRQVEFKLSRKVIAEVLSYSIPLLPHGLSSWAMTMIDRIFLNVMVSIRIVSLYNVAFQISSILNYVSMAFIQAYGPWFFEQISLGKAGKDRVVAVATAGVITFSFLGFSLSVFSPDILRIMVTEEYFESYKVVPILTFAFVFHTVYFFVAGPLFVKNTKVFAVVSLLGAAINIFLNWILIPIYGLFGAAVSSLIQKALISVVYAVQGYKYEKIKFRWIILYSVPSIAFCCSLSVVYFETWNFWVSLVTKMVLCLAILIVIFYVFREEIVTIIADYKLRRKSK